MTPKSPTPQGISALLAKAGFTRAIVKASAAGCAGFAVTADRSRSDAVRVRYRSWSMVGPNSRSAERNADYAKAIRDAGWTVDTTDYELIVTPGKEGQ
jgi:hypothetical protein